MGRREVYCIDERQQIYFTRWELEDQPVEVEETQRTTPYRHKDYPTRCIRWTGLHLTKYGDQRRSPWVPWSVTPGLSWGYRL